MIPFVAKYLLKLDLNLLQINISNDFSNSCVKKNLAVQSLCNIQNFVKIFKWKFKGPGFEF